MNVAKILIQDLDGVCVPFDLVALQTQLKWCFIATRHEDNSFAADDLALAVEYALTRGDNGDIVRKEELVSAVAAMLEDTGFPDVAEFFRHGRSDDINPTELTAEQVTDILRKHLDTPSENLLKIAEKTRQAIASLNLPKVSPRLILELARCYCHRDYRVDKPIEVITLTEEKIFDAMPFEIQNMMAAEILKIRGITTLFARVQCEFSIKKLVNTLNLTPPLLELQIEPIFLQAGQILDRAKKIVDKKIGAETALPFFLNLPDLLDFTTEYVGCSRENSGKVANEFADLIASEITDGVYKLTFNDK